MSKVLKRQKQIDFETVPETEIQIIHVVVRALVEFLNKYLSVRFQVRSYVWWRTTYVLPYHRTVRT